MRTLDLDAARAATLGGLVFGAGGGGLERGLRAAEAVLQIGQPTLATLDELDDDDHVVLLSGIGAPGQHKGAVWPRDAQRALQLLEETWEGPGRIAGLMVSHPGAFMTGLWLPAALDAGLAVVDCAANGRGHPTVKMGGMGLANRPDVQIIQAGVGGAEEQGTHLEIVVRGTVATTSDLLHQASTAAGGALMACRGPFSVAFCRQAAAAGAVSACIRLGEAMRAAAGEGPEATVAAIVATLGGRELGRGTITRHDITLRHNWEVGALTVDVDGAEVELAVCNEYMAADRDGERLATFPDLIVTLSPRDGMPSAATRLQPGEETVVVVVPRDRISLGAGVYDASVYPEVEALTGKSLAPYALGQGGK